MRFLLIILFFLNIWTGLLGVEVTVAIDGSGNYTSIQKAVDAQRAFNPEPITIKLKPGIYREKIVVPTWATGITMLGEDPLNTIIVYNDYSGKGIINTFTSYTFLVHGNDFRAENITFMNDAGPVGQAVALHVEGDRAVFVNCRMIGDQDTFYAGREASRIYIKNCYIEGTTDFIFGPSTVLFDGCIIKSKKNSYITAASTPSGIKYGFVFINCRLIADEGIDKVYLGRPWRDYAKTVFIKCEMGNHILPAGWHNWGRPAAEKTVYYGEFLSSGPGGNIKNRVGWSKKISKKGSTKYFTKKVLNGFEP